MYLCYIDESGHTGNNLQDVHQPYLVLTALLITPDKVKEVENEVRALGYRHFGAESRNTDFEFHGDDIYNKRGRYFKKLSLDQRFKILDEIVDIVVKTEAIKIGYVCIDKKRYYGKLHVQQAAFSLLVEYVEENLKTLDSYCLLIADEQDELEQKLIDDLDLFKQQGTNFGYKSVNVDRIIDSVHFVQSNNNYLMQLCDVICYLIRKGSEASGKLYSEYKAVDAEIKGIELSDWFKEKGHRGYRYFLSTYNRIQKKGWLFVKNFP